MNKNHKQNKITSNGMRKLTFNFKYTFFALTLVIASFVFSHSASADQYSHTCLDGGLITSNVNTINPAPPYVVGMPFTATGYIHSTCASASVKMTVKNNNGTVFTLIPTTPIAAGDDIPSAVSPATISFTAPVIQGSSYAVHFVTEVTEDSTVYVLVNQDIVETSQVVVCEALEPQSGGGEPNRILFYWAVTPTLSFFSDEFTTVPRNVSGLNLRLRYSPGWSSVYTPVLSGASTTLDTVFSGQTIFDAQSECYAEGGPSIPEWVNGTSETPPYTLLVSVPSAPWITLNGPSMVYTGSNVDINWNVSYATSPCISTNFTVGSSTGNFTGTESVTINGDTTYTLSCTNPVGTTTQSLTIIDFGPAPVVNYCWAWPDYWQSCTEPSICSTDWQNPGYEICNFN